MRWRWWGLKRIHADILARRNLEAYALLAVVVALTILGVLGGSETVMLAAVLAGIAFLVFNTTVPATKVAFDINDFLRSRQDYSPFVEVIQGAHTLWIYGPSAINVLSRENVAFMKQHILEKGGQIRVLVQDPDNTTNLDILHRQLDDEMSNLKNDLTRSIDILKNMVLLACSGKAEYRFLSYCPGFSMVVVNPNTAGGRVIVEFWGFSDKQAMPCRMHIDFTRQQSLFWFDYWVNQYDEMWRAARVPLSEAITSERIE